MSHIFPSLARIRILSRHTCGDFELIYRIDDATGQVELSQLPIPLSALATPRRGNMDDDFQVRRLTWSHAPWLLDSLVHLKLSGSANPAGLAAGTSLRDAPDTARLVFDTQRVETDGDRVTVATRLLARDKRYACEHRAWWFSRDYGIRLATTFINLSPAPLSLELLTSFSLGDLTPFAPAEATDRLRLHRYRSWWSGEARRDSQSLEALHLERSWGTGPARHERFGQVGSLPVRQFFPFAAVEDHVAGAVWAVQLSAPGSWQIELSRRGDSLALSGGQADRLLGHWIKTIAPGECFESTEALLTCVHGTVDDACQRLTRLHARGRLAQPGGDQSLPVVFNDWCTSWGNPTHDSILALAERLRGTAVRYLVIDAGWYADPGTSWGHLHGEWQPSRVRFPQGLRATADAVRACGLVPGLWFEFETCGELSPDFQRHELLLHLDGAPGTSGTRRFYDFRRPEVIELLATRVIGLLREAGFGYLKVDYNESIGLGVDGAESPGEGLRAHLAGVLAFFRRIRAELPELVIENCSSGGHRLEAGFTQLTAMGSFSDAHEGPEVPVIAANLHNLLLPEQNLIWAVLRANDDAARLHYSLAASLLGRLCLSGDLTKLDAAQRAILDEALAFYPHAAPVLARGRSVLHDSGRSASWRDLRGWQAVVRTADDARTVLVVLHRFAPFANTPAAPISLPLPVGAWRITRTFGHAAATASVDPATASVVYPATEAWTAAAFLLEVR